MPTYKSLKKEIDFLFQASRIFQEQNGLDVPHLLIKAELCSRQHPITQVKINLHANGS